MTKILITGASSEIGLAIARTFDSPANELVLHCHSNAARLRESTSGFTATVTIVNADFSMESELNAFISTLKEISIVINAAAFTRAELLPNLTDEDMRRMLQVNVHAPVAICRAVLPFMIARRMGVIVNISSIAASKGNRGQTVYAGTKGFIESFTRSLAAEFGTKGVRVNAVAPGAIHAGSLKSLLQMAGDEVKSHISLNRFGTPEDVAAMVHFLCTDGASFINGQIIRVDGGFLKGI